MSDAMEQFAETMNFPSLVIMLGDASVSTHRWNEPSDSGHQLGKLPPRVLKSKIAVTSFLRWPR